MVYLLCFDKKFKHAKHYIGYAENQRTFEARMKHHAKGSGSRLMAAIAKAGIGFCVARTWPDGDRNFERKLKNRKKAAELCPHCTAALKEKKRREKVLVQEKAVIEKLNAPPIVCPVVNKTLEAAKEFDARNKAITREYIDMIKRSSPNFCLTPTKPEVANAQPSSPACLSRWAKIRSGLARLWLVFKSKFVSK